MSGSFFKPNSAFKGKGLVSSKPQSYPKLPESPTNKPEIMTNNESLLPPKPGSEERERRFQDLLQRYQQLRPSLWNKIFGVKKPEVKLNKYGEPKSAFTVRNNLGFKS